MMFGALPAAAHVTVNPGEVEGGGFTTLTFRMPNERDDANTTKLDVTFPEAQPLASVRLRPHPGWNYQIQKATLATPIDFFGEQITEVVRTITWTPKSPDTAVKPPEFEEFQVSVGRLPESGQLVFKAIQTYDSGEVVRWIEEAAPGAEEPERPAPMLTIVPPKAEAPATPTAPATPAASAHTGDEVGSGTATLALIVAVAAAALGAGGLALGLAARRSAPAASQPGAAD